MRILYILRMSVVLQRADILRIAAEAECDPRTVESYVAGNEVRAGVGARIARAMAKLSLTFPPQRGVA